MTTFLLSYLTHLAVDSTIIRQNTIVLHPHHTGMVAVHRISKVDDPFSYSACPKPKNMEIPAENDEYVERLRAIK